MDPSSLPFIDWERIESFVGFGQPDALVVFIGLEEGLKCEDALLEDLTVRSTYSEPVMDLMKAHEGIAGTEDYFNPERAPRQPTWRVMADLMERRGGNPAPTGQDRKRYRTLDLGRSHGETLLTELLPYPHPKTRHWLYARFGSYLTRAEYETARLPVRTRMLRNVLSEADRDLIVCYGKNGWPDFKALFDDVDWRPDGIHCVGTWRGTRVVLTNHFSRSDFNTDEQLADLARVALVQR